jgi:RNA polymerase sigma factor (sigma-70 family)
MARGGDAEAFGEFYGRHETIVAGFLARRAGDPTLTADLTAETFAAALLRSKQFRDEGQSAIGWLLGIARNLLLRTWERRKTERRARARLGVEPASLTDASIERIEALVDSSSPTNPLTLALEALPEAEQAAVRARVLDEQPYEALSRTLGVSQATVRQRVSRGLARMRTTLEGRQP